MNKNILYCDYRDFIETALRIFILHSFSSTKEYSSVNNIKHIINATNRQRN